MKKKKCPNPNCRGNYDKYVIVIDSTAPLACRVGIKIPTFDELWNEGRLGYGPF